MVRFRQRRKPSFFWQPLVILCPVVILAVLGFLSLRQDKIIAQHDAAERARTIADSLLPGLWSVITNAGNAESFEHHAFQIDNSGELLFPPPRSLTPSPEPLKLGELTWQQAALWEQAQVAEMTNDISAAIVATRDFLAANPPERFAAVGSYNLSALLMQHGDLQDAADTCVSLLEDYPNAVSESGLTPLQQAAISGHLVVARFLLDNGADVNLQARSGETALLYAASVGHKGLVELLLSRGAKLDLPDSGGSTPLHFAARKGFRSVVEVLLTHGANVNAKTKSDLTPLHLAVANGFKSVADLLINNGADLNAQSFNAGSEPDNRTLTGTPLHIAAQRNDHAVAELLLASKANCNATNTAGETPLHIAASHGYPKFAELLLANKAAVDPINKNGETPLDLAAKSGSASTVFILLSHGANVNFRNPVDGDSKNWTPLLYAVNSKQNETVTLLLQTKADPNIKSEGPKTTGLTPLLLAVWKSEPDMVASLLEAKADPNAKDERGFSPAHAALSISDASVCKRILISLLDHGADTETTDNDGRTLLTTAVERMNKDFVELLLAHKANVNAQNPFGRTPLHFLVSRVNQHPYEKVAAIAESLISAGANANLQNKDGRTPLNQLLIEPKSRGLNLTQSDLKLGELLRAHGAVADLPRLDVIQVGRSDANFSRVIFTKGTNGWDQFTLYELIAVQYRLLSSSPEGESLQPLENSIRDNRMPFPDFTRIRIRHPKPDFKNWAERNIDIANALSSGDCSTDVPLEFGDQVEIPEADHVLGEEWSGLAKENVGLQKCLTRQVSIVIKGQSKSVTLKTGFLPRDLDTSPVVIASFMIRPVLLNSKLLLSSSDLSRVKLIRTDKTGQKRELIVDCTGDKSLATPNARLRSGIPGSPVRAIVPGQQTSTPAPDSAPSVWLRDGDIIEVPDKP